MIFKAHIGCEQSVHGIYVFIWRWRWFIWSGPEDGGEIAAPSPFNEHAPEAKDSDKKCSFLWRTLTVLFSLQGCLCVWGNVVNHCRSHAEVSNAASFMQWAAIYHMWCGCLSPAKTVSWNGFLIAGSPLVLAYLCLKTYCHPSHWYIFHLCINEIL